MVKAVKSVYADIIRKWSPICGDSSVSSIVLNRLLDKYDEPHRFARDAYHLQNVMMEIDFDLGSWPDSAMKSPSEAVYMAGFYAWSIYDPKDLFGSLDKSSEEAYEELTVLGFSSGFCGAVADIISELKYEVPTCREGERIQDAAVGILSQGPSIYDQWALGLRYEYHFWSDAEWIQYRTAYLNQMLQKPRIYFLLSNSCYETVAYNNLRRELDMLNAGAVPQDDSLDLLLQASV